jgi:hypothetical protein
MLMLRRLLMDQGQLQKIKSGRLLDVIREKPAMYIGSRSLSALAQFLAGYGFALQVHEIPSTHRLPQDFHEWVAYRLHFSESTSGFKNMILKRVPDEPAALDRFYELLDEHRTRRPRVVATAQGFRREYTTSSFPDGTEIKTTGVLPEALALVAYTDDPGFFVSCDDGEVDFPGKDRFFPTLQWFERRYGVGRADLTILDSETFNRWLGEEDRFKRDTPTAKFES